MEDINPRGYWLKNIRGVREKLQKPNLDCIYNLSLCEITVLVIALDQYKKNFYQGDCEPFIKELNTKYRAKKKHLKEFRKKERK